MSGANHRTQVERFSFNQAAVRFWPLPHLVEGCVTAGVGRAGLLADPSLAAVRARAFFATCGAVR